MNWFAVLAPHRLVRLFGADVMNVTRDPMLLFAIALSLLPSLGLHVFHEVIDAASLQTFGAKGISAALTTVALVLPAILTGWVTGFLLLEDRDDGPLLAIDVTPVGKLGFITYRVLVTAIVTALITLAATWLLDLKIDHITTIILVAVEAVIAAALLPAFARNKVEGLALSKLTNIFAVVPLIALVPSPWRLLAGVVPSYWLGEMMFGIGPRLPDATMIVAGIVVHGVWLAVALQLFSRRVG